MHYVSLLSELGKLLKCEEPEIQERLNHPKIFEKVNKYMEGRNVRTTYKNRNGDQHEFTFYRVSLKTNLEQHAYQGYLGINLAQHFYIKYRIRLFYPRMRCAIDFVKSGHNRYFPLELLEILHEGEPENCPICAREPNPESQKEAGQNCSCPQYEQLLNLCSHTYGKNPIW